MGSVVAHPLRSRCLSVLAERTASPVELAHEFRKPLSDVSYHITMLVKAGVVELVGERPTRGSVEHFYRATRLPALNREENAELPLDQRLEFARQVFQLAVADATAALDAGTFNRRPSAWSTRMPMTVDDEGWEELSEIYAAAWEGLEQVRIKTERRRAERGVEESAAEEVPVTTFLTFFERPAR
jgi:DNA-binding transcriptional ArsR family regulator